MEAFLQTQDLWHILIQPTKRPYERAHCQECLEKAQERAIINPKLDYYLLSNTNMRMALFTCMVTSSQWK